MICVSISDQSQIDPVVRSGAELIELRLDLLLTDPARLFPQIPPATRTVVTCRPGEYGDRERINMLVAAIGLGAAYVDLELDSPRAFTEQVISATSGKGCEVIFSHHDFEGTPGRGELKTILENCYERGGAVAKIATQVHNRSDILNLLSLYDLPGRKVVLGMGIPGRITRVISPYLGAEFTFASPGEGQETAPGQLESTRLNDIYKVIDAS